MKYKRINVKAKVFELAMLCTNGVPDLFYACIEAMHKTP